jgi:Putative addiction module component
MNVTRDDTIPPALMEAALMLPQAAKKKLAKILTESPEASPPFEISPEWRAEILRRIEAVRSGEMKTMSLKEAMKRLRQVDLESRPK